MQSCSRAEIIFGRYGKALMESLGWSKPGHSRASRQRRHRRLSLVVVVLRYAPADAGHDTPFEKLLDDPPAAWLFFVSESRWTDGGGVAVPRTCCSRCWSSAIGVFPGILVTSAAVRRSSFDAERFHLAKWRSDYDRRICAGHDPASFRLDQSIDDSPYLVQSLPFLALLINGNPLARK